VLSDISYHTQKKKKKLVEDFFTKKKINFSFLIISIVSLFSEQHNLQKYIIQSFFLISKKKKNFLSSLLFFSPLLFKKIPSRQISSLFICHHQNFFPHSPSLISSRCSSTSFLFWMPSSPSSSSSFSLPAEQQQKILSKLIIKKLVKSDFFPSSRFTTLL
jgi:hypothetical protein